MTGLLLFAASMLSGQTATMDCAHRAVMQTREVRGPSGLTAVLQVTSMDDGGKNTHMCMADYNLLILPANGRAGVISSLLSSDGEWGRKLAVRLDGFSADGTRVYGVISERGGKYPVSTVFDYAISTQSVELLELQKHILTLRASKCGVGFAVAGTTAAGAIVVAPAATEPCQATYLWVLDKKSGELQPLPPERPIERLYAPGLQ
jgi:hypothetical protein